jgi:fimbrial isopeptide formation D2 family protein/LPXTG-motif cell wall-anchored protein
MITEDGTRYNMERGQKIAFRLTLNIPSDIADVTYSVTDTPTEGLQFIADSLIADGLTAGSDYTITANGDGGFTLALNSNSATVQALAGSTLIIDYQMELTKDLVPDAIEGNKANVKIGDTPQPEVTPKEKFQTGGKKIVKKDAHTDKTLAGAEFVVINKAGQYGEFELNTAGTAYALIGWVDTATSKSTITSLANGSVNVIGLKDGEYTLNETKAPSDKYVKIPDGTIKFEVKVGTYEEAQVITVPNTPKGLLPSTGGSGIYIYLVIGAALMLGAYSWFRKSKAQAEA